MRQDLEVALSADEGADARLCRQGCSGPRVRDMRGDGASTPSSSTRTGPGPPRKSRRISPANWSKSNGERSRDRREVDRNLAAGTGQRLHPRLGHRVADAFGGAEGVPKVVVDETWLGSSTTTAGQTAADREKHGEAGEGRRSPTSWRTPRATLWRAASGDARLPPDRRAHRDGRGLTARASYADSIDAIHGQVPGARVVPFRLRRKGADA